MMGLPNNIRIEDYPLVAALEEVFWSEIDRQYMDGEISSGAMDSAYCDPVAGEIQGCPDVSKAIVRMLEAYWEEEGR
jgi:hypothetical protein